jgi:hypothetical protein
LKLRGTSLVVMEDINARKALRYISKSLQMVRAPRSPSVTS